MRWLIIALGLLATIPISDWLADQQVRKDKRHEEVAYTKAQSEAMSDFVALHLPPSPSKMVYVWRDKKAAMLAEAYSLSPEDIGKTVDVRKLK